VFEYYNDVLDRTSNESDAGDVTAMDSWVAGGGIAYEFAPWTVGAQYSHLDADGGGDSVVSDFTQDRAMITATYDLGTGVQLDAELAYTWVDTDPEGFTTADGVEIDNYDALELGMGVALTF
jgi:predicted porin